MHLGSPYVEGEEEHSKCEMYQVISLMKMMMVERLDNGNVYGDVGYNGNVSGGELDPGAEG